MPFVQKWSNPKSKRCIDPEHKPPGMIVLEPGIHVWECPGCHNRTSVNVPEVSL